MVQASFKKTAGGAMAFAAVLSFGACGRTPLDPGELRDQGISGSAGTANQASETGFGGASRGGAWPGDTAGVAGALASGVCEDGTPTWSCAAATLSGPCCDANYSLTPQCSDTCQLESDPLGTACPIIGETIEVPVVSGVSEQCEGSFFACYARRCTCGCPNGSSGAVPDLSATCEPVLFSNAHHFPQEIALHGEFVFWTVYGFCPLAGDEDLGTGELFGARRSDASGAVLIAYNLPCPVGIVAFGDDLYWTNQPGASGGSVWTAKTNGDNVRVLADDLDYPTTIRADADYVYWYEEGYPESGIYRIDPAGGAPPELFATVANVDSETLSAVVLDEQYVYWIDRGSGLANGGVFRASKIQGEAELLAEVNGPLELALSAQGLFWLSEPTYQNYALSFMGWTDPAPTVLTSPPSRPSALSAFLDFAYWVQQNDDSTGSVYGIQLGQSQPFPIAADQPSPVALAADADYVFWANQNYPELVGHNGEIMRACR